MPKAPSRKTVELQSAIASSIYGSGLKVGTPPKKAAKSGRIMYIECKAGTLNGEARIGRVTYSKTGSTLYYRGQTFQSLKGAYKSNYFCLETREPYWISGPKRRGGDRLYISSLPVTIDADARVEYWRDIRGQPERIEDETV